jgi:hypothetical protein
MVSLKFTSSLIFVSSVRAVTYSNAFQACGQANILMRCALDWFRLRDEANIFSGLPPWHPLVIEQGQDPKMIDALIRSDAAEVIKAGYNIKSVFYNPPQRL